MMLADCIACRFGNHGGHVEWPSKPPPGVIGGHKCPCKGECERDPGRGERAAGLPAIQLPADAVPGVDNPPFGRPGSEAA